MPPGKQGGSKGQGTAAGDWEGAEGLGKAGRLKGSGRNTRLEAGKGTREWREVPQWGEVHQAPPGLGQGEVPHSAVGWAGTVKLIISHPRVLLGGHSRTSLHLCQLPSLPWGGASE